MVRLNRLRLARLKAGKSQHEVALETGLSQTVISLYERELRKPKLDHLRALASYYRITPEELQEASIERVC